jgi:hypothetical protein
MQETPALLLPYLYSAVCFLIMKFVASVVMIVKADVYAKALSMNISEGNTTMIFTVDSASIVTQGVLNLVGVALGIYYFIVIYSFYTELRNGGSRSIYRAFGGQPGLAPGVIHPLGTTVIRGYNTQGAGHVIAQQASYYQQQPDEGLPVAQGSVRKDVPPSYEKATSASASQY